MSLLCHRVQLLDPAAHLPLAFSFFLPTFCSQAVDREGGTVIVKDSTLF